MSDSDEVMVSAAKNFNNKLSDEGNIDNHVSDKSEYADYIEAMKKGRAMILESMMKAKKKKINDEDNIDNLAFDKVDDYDINELIAHENSIDLEKETDEYIPFFILVSKMRDMQNELIDLNKAITNEDFYEVICKHNEAVKAAEKQVDDFIKRKKMTEEEMRVKSFPPDIIHCPNCGHPINKEDFNYVPNEIKDLLSGKEFNIGNNPLTSEEVDMLLSRKDNSLEKYLMELKCGKNS